jgi:hypothetical protein
MNLISVFAASIKQIGIIERKGKTMRNLFEAGFIFSCLAAGIFMGMIENKVLRFNDKMVDYAESPFLDHKNLSLEMEKWRRGEQIDVALLKKELDSLAADYSKHLQLAQSMTCPNDSTECQAFKEATLRYMQCNMDLIKAQQGIIPSIKRNNPAAPQAVAATTIPLQPLATQSQRLLRALQDKQRKMAAKHDFKLE